MSWVLKQSAVDRAAQVLEIEHEVRILPRWMKYATGRYRGMYADVHRITAATNVSWREATKIIWHELTHAKQRETWGCKGFDEEYDRQLQEIGLDPSSVGRYGAYLPPDYKQIPFEVEAFENEKKFQFRYLTQPASEIRSSPKRRVAMLQDTTNSFEDLFLKI